MAAELRGRRGGRRPAIRPAARAWLWATVALTAGAIVIAIALAPPASAPPGRGLAYLLFAGSSAHVASTGVVLHGAGGPRPRAPAPRPVPVGAARADRRGRRDRRRHRRPRRSTWLLLPYFGWQFFHYQKQNLGMAALAAAAHRVAGLRPAERRVLLAAGARRDRRRWSARPGCSSCRPAAASRRAVPAGGGRRSRSAVAAGLVLLARRPAGPAAARDSAPPTCSALVFWLPVFVFGSPYAAVGGDDDRARPAVPAADRAGGRGQPERRRSDRGRAGRLASLVASWATSPWPAAPRCRSPRTCRDSAALVRLLFGGFLGAVMAHFVIDAGLWRLRDRFPRAFLAERVPYLVPTWSRVDAGSAADRSSADIRSATCHDRCRPTGAGGARRVRPLRGTGHA